jgi:hypothetical protein
MVDVSAEIDEGLALRMASFMPVVEGEGGGGRGDQIE